MTKAPYSGGSAFPILPPVDQSGYTPAGYPSPPEHGMTLRQWYAGHALAGLLASQHFCPENPAHGAYARQAFALADAMIEQEYPTQKG